MAANPTPTNLNVLVARYAELIGGCVALETETGLKQFTAARLQATLDAARQAQAAVGRLKAERGEFRKAWKRLDREGKKLLGRCRVRLAVAFGSRYSAAWEAAGFHGGSTMVPEAFAKRLALLDLLATYLSMHPELENPDLGVTAALCQTSREALSAGRYSLEHAGSLLCAAVRERNAAAKRLRGGMRGLVRELTLLLEPGDVRWLRFGLNMPTRVRLAEPVETVKLTPLSQGAVLAEWTRARRATRYRVQVRSVGQDEFQPTATVVSRSLLLKHLPPGSTVEVRVIAANEAGESRASATASAVVR